MKKLTCDMCGGTDLLKKDGMFVCQNCQTKYSIEEAKKMMVEGTVQVSGNVSVTNAGTIDNFLKMAQNAYASKNHKEAEDYCNKVLEIDSKNYQAWLLKGRAAGWQATVKNNRFSEVVNCFTKAIENAPAEKVEEVKKESSDELQNLSVALINLTCNHFREFPSDETARFIMSIFFEIKNTSEILSKKFNITLLKEIKNQIVEITFNTACDVFIKAGSNYLKIGFSYIDDRYFNELLNLYNNCIILFRFSIDFPDEDDKINLERYEVAIVLLNGCKTESYLGNVDSGAQGRGISDSMKKNVEKLMSEYAGKIIDIDSSFQNERFDIKEREGGEKEVVFKEEPKKSSGCYVATAVYGSYDCPQVWVLRRFRDYTLAASWYGRAFIKAYYATSPTIVKYFGKSSLFKNLFHPILNLFTVHLQKKGFSSHPYSDKQY